MVLSLLIAGLGAVPVTASRQPGTDVSVNVAHDVNCESVLTVPATFRADVSFAAYARAGNL